MQRHSAVTPSFYVDLRKKRSVAQLGKGAAAGAIGGFLGAWTMSLPARFTRNLAARSENSRSELVRLEARRFVNGSSLELDSITAAADWINRLAGHRLSPGQKGFVAAVVHYGMGAGLGAAYGALVERAPAFRLGMGSAFGVGESLAVESVGNSVLGVTRPLREYSILEHLQSAVDHAIYGITLELTRRSLRKAL
jgi:uncharacterized membrane protein YagU involved in acid resistance